MKKDIQKQKPLCMIPIEPLNNDQEFRVPPGCQLPKETVNSLADLCEILKGIRHRLLSEGYAIIDGKFYSPQGKLVYERRNYKGK